jgi:hypothetical protein
MRLNLAGPTGIGPVPLGFQLERLGLSAVWHVLGQKIFYKVFTVITCNKYVRRLVRMSNITVRVPEELKGRMKRCKSVNWSEVARKAFEEAAHREEMQCAAEVIKNLRLGSKTKWDGAKEIRKWRDAAT